MRFIISPAKKMKMDTDSFAAAGTPLFLQDAGQLLAYLRTLSLSQCKALWKCNDALAQLNYQRVQQMNLERNLTPALFAYEGIQYQYMAPDVFTQEQLDYVQEHLRILSGFYGLLRPLDGVAPYRLEMQAKPSGASFKTLYEFWGNRLADALSQETNCLVNLASKEYSKCVQGKLSAGVELVQVTFGQRTGDKITEKATLAKMARGAMVRYAAECNCQTPQDLTGFNRFGFMYDAQRSTAQHLVFVQTEPQGD